MRFRFFLKIAGLGLLTIIFLRLPGPKLAETTTLRLAVGTRAAMTAHSSRHRRGQDLSISQLGVVSIDRRRAGLDRGEYATACSFAGPEIAYLSFGSAKKILKWDISSGTSQIITIDPAWTPTSLAWEPRLGELYVLDSFRNRVLVVDDSGAVTRQSFLVAGQAAATIRHIGETLVLGGPVSLNQETTFLISTHSRNGKYLARFFQEGTRTRLVNSPAPPVLLAVGSESKLLAAEPTVPVLHVFDALGNALGSVDIQPEGFRPPPVFLPGSGQDPVSNYSQWRSEWTPLVFLHAAGSAVVTAFEMQDARGYLLQVRARWDGHIDAERLIDSMPVCGFGSRLLVSSDNTTGPLELAVVELQAPALARGEDSRE